MKISPIWRNRFGHFAVCLGPASMIVGFATISLGDRGNVGPVVLLSLSGPLVAVLIGLFTRRVLAIVLGASAFLITMIEIPGLIGCAAAALKPAGSESCGRSIQRRRRIL